MRLAVLSDIHGNLPALQAVLAADARQAGHIDWLRGLPAFDHDAPHPHRLETGSPDARYALVEPTADGWQVALRAVVYDWVAAARRAEEHGRADWAYALLSGRVGRLESQVLGP